MVAPQQDGDSGVEPGRIGPDHPQYVAVVNRRFNKRFTARPDYVRLAASTEHVLTAVQEAVNEQRRLVVTSGGHCLEGFVSDPDVRVIVDVSRMKRVQYDAERRAVAVEAGATVGETFQALFETWGTVVPLGEYPGIGVGGHVAGGAFGFLCRQLGLAADYLYAVEVVTVDEAGRLPGTCFGMPCRFAAATEAAGYGGATPSATRAALDAGHALTCASARTSAERALRN